MGPLFHGPFFVSQLGKLNALLQQEGNRCIFYDIVRVINIQKDTNHIKIPLTRTNLNPSLTLGLREDQGQHMVRRRETQTAPSLPAGQELETRCDLDKE